MPTQWNTLLEKPTTGNNTLKFRNMPHNPIMPHPTHPGQTVPPKRIRPLRMVFGLAMAVIGLGASIVSADNRLSTVSVPSTCMSKNIDAAVMLPTSYASSPGRQYSVIYFLDGYNTGGRDGIRIFYDWYQASLMSLCDQYDVIMVAVGCANKWYFDSPVDPTVKWQTFLTNELLPYVDTHYRSVATRQGRAITGLSMGGHGALYTAFRNSDKFIAAGSTSGAVDFRPWPGGWEIAAVLGPKATNQSVWDANVVVNNLSALPTAGMGICFDCGTSDGFFLDVNRALDQKMTAQSIPHTYVESAGGHTMDYWQGTFPKHVVFFSKYLTALTGGSFVTRINTVKTFAAMDFRFADANNSLSAIKVTSLPTHGTLTLGGTPISTVPSSIIPVASLGTLIYTPTTGYTGAESFNFQVRDTTTFSPDAVMVITVTADIPVLNGSFETPGVSGWSVVGSPWTSGAGGYGEYPSVPTFYDSVPTGAGSIAALLGTGVTASAPLVQNLGVSVAAGDTLSVTFWLGKGKGWADSAGASYFEVAGTKYPTVFNTTDLSQGSWKSITMTQTITNSGNPSLGFYWTSGANASVDNISNVSVTSGAVDPNAPSSTNGSLTVNEDAATALTTANFGTYSDPHNVALAAVRITALPALGTLKNNGTTVVSGALPLTVAVADINAGKLTYQSALNGNGVGYTTLGFKVMNGNNVWSVAAATMTVNVTPVNDAPTSTGGSLSMTKNTVKTFAAADFPFADVDTGDSLGAIKVTSLPAQGALKLNGTAIITSPSAEILVANIGTLTYTPAAGYQGADSFKFQVRDATTFSADATLAINVSSDIPVAPAGLIFRLSDNGGTTRITASGSATLVNAINAQGLADAAVTPSAYKTTASWPYGGYWTSFTSGTIKNETQSTTLNLTRAGGIRVNNNWNGTNWFEIWSGDGPIVGNKNDVISFSYTLDTPAPFSDVSAGFTSAYLGGDFATYFGSTGAKLTTLAAGPPPGSYAAWAAANGAGSQTMDQDHDHDGVPNGIEYFLGGSANTTGVTALPGVVKAVDGKLSVTWTKSADFTGAYGTSYVIQTSDSLTGTWDNEPATGGDVTLSGNDVVYTFPSSGPARKFVRLKVMGIP
jgi:S-formylglutathione hydrolase